MENKENNAPSNMIQMADVKIDVENETPTFKESLQNGNVSTQENLTFTAPTIVDNLNAFCRTHRVKVFLLIKGFLLVGFLCYVGYSFSVEFGDEGSIRLLVCTLFGLLLLSWRFIKGRHPGRVFPNGCYSVWEEKTFRKVLRWIFYLGVGGAAATYTIVNTLIDHPENLISLTGIVVFMVLMYITSTNRQKVNWHTLYWGLMIQLLLGILFVSTEVGVLSMEYISDRFLEFTSYSDTGAAIVFTEKYKEFQFVFKSMPRVLYFVTVINVLQHLGVITFMVKTVGSFLAFCLGTKPVESLVAASNIIMGLGEAFMIVRVYLDEISTSELFALMVCGMASMAGSALLIVQSFGVPMPLVLTASVMSAPAALVCAKLNVPEENVSESSSEDKKSYLKNGINIKGKEISGSNNILEAITKGAQVGTTIVVSVVVSMLVYLSLVDFLNATVEWFGNRVAIEGLSFEDASFLFVCLHTCMYPVSSLEMISEWTKTTTIDILQIINPKKICAFVLWPVAFILGIPSQDCLIIGRFLGIRGVANIGISYFQMGQYIRNNKQLSQYESMYNDTVHMANRDIFLPMWNATLRDGVLQERSVVIGAYALCGFSSLSNIGMTLGILSAVAPRRLNDVTKVVFRAFIVSTIASFLTACIAGLLYKPS